MTKSLSETLGMKSLEEILSETEDDIEENLPVPVENSSMSVADAQSSDHSQAMDDVYDEAIDTARKIIDMGMNIEPGKAPRLLEVGGQYLKAAMEAKNSKRDAQLKLMKLLQEQRKLELEERSHGIGEGTLTGEVVFEGDRNKLLKILRDQREQKGDE